MLSFIRTTVAQGLLFILPLMLIVILMEKAVHLLREPIRKLLPMLTNHSFAGITRFTLVALIAVVLICFFAGLLAKTAPAARLAHSLEENVLGKVPGYELLKDAAQRFTGLEHAEGTQVGLINEDDAWLFCLVLETRDAWLSIYIPGGGPAGGSSGEVRVVPASQIRLIGLAWLPVLACLRRDGRGALELASPWLRKP